MSTEGAYVFKRSALAVNGLVPDESAHLIEPGAWAWVRKTWADGPDFLAVYCMCPDCGHLMTVWRKFGDEVRGHRLDADGSLHPSVLHTWKDNGVEQCGFHTIPTKLADFIDLR